MTLFVLVLFSGFATQAEELNINPDKCAIVVEQEAIKH